MQRALAVEDRQAAVLNAVVAIDETSPNPPFTYSGFFRYSPTPSSAFVGTSELNGISWLTHWSYTSAPPSRRTKSSIQSVTGQPVAASDAMPAHHGL